MPESYTQDTRLGELKPPAALEGLVLTRLTANEGISELFEFSVEGVSLKDLGSKLHEAIGKEATVVVRSYGNERFFTGTVVHAGHVSSEDEGFRYRLTLRPWLHMLSKRVTSRIFKDKSVKDIISQIAGYVGRSIEFKLEHSYPSLEYVVQHRESDLDFILRLMEAHGMSYHFRFKDGSYDTIVTDHAREDNPGGGTRKLTSQDKSIEQNEEHLFAWMPQRRFTTSNVRVNDYYFEHSTTQQTADATSSPDFDPKGYEYYDHGYPQALNKETNASYGRGFAQGLLDSFRSEDRRVIAAGDAASLTPGYKMTLTDAQEFNGSYLILRCTHGFAVEDYRSGGSGTHYQGSYELLPAEQNFVPPRTTPRPVISGVQTALVVGESEIDVDKYGRILIDFYWNVDQKTERPVMRCRVMQSWAGAGWGTIFTPRRGMEVLVQFIDGDPDRPLVVGCVYNDAHMPPYTLPGQDNKNISGWKTRSTEGGGDANFNEFVFDDTKSKELVRLHAEKDLDTSVEHDEKRLVEHDRVTEIKNDDKLTVTNNLVMEAMNSITIKVGGNSIVLDQSGITIKGLQITVEASGALSTEGKATATHKAGGIMTISGALVKIN